LQPFSLSLSTVFLQERFPPPVLTAASPFHYNRGLTC